MIATPPPQPAAERVVMKRAHTVAIEEDQRRMSRRFGRLVASQPALAITSAVALGVIAGWLIKRKEW